MENSQPPTATIDPTPPDELLARAIEKRGRRAARPTPTTPDLLSRRLFLRVREFSDLTGTPLATCYALIKSGKIEGVTYIGNSIRIPVAAIKA
jgi:excisionase family DNA binding protein